MWWCPVSIIIYYPLNQEGSPKWIRLSNRLSLFNVSNNINLFEPKGQFGTRLQGGQDSASERYIHTNLSSITRKIFVQEDDAILEYLDDDGIMVEPIYYLPVIPVILVNGSKGIGTGFSTDILPYNPISLINYVKASLNNDILPELIPYFEGFKGTVEKVEAQKYLIKGKYDILSDTQVRVTELPIGIWTDDYNISFLFLRIHYYPNL